MRVGNELKAASAKKGTARRGPGKDNKGPGVSKRTGILMAVAISLAMITVILLHVNKGPLADPEEERIKKIVSCTVVAVSCGVLICLYDKIVHLPVELWQNRRLIWKLAKNDFKKRYAGSYLGAVWALAQPVITVVMYYIVFDKIMGTGGTGLRDSGEVPFVLFLTAGLVPWFFFAEAWTNATNALREYDYLVKKVVFKISILPIIKTIAATFIHAFFVLLLLVVAAVYGYYPTVYALQIFYYSGCLFLFVLALSYTTCSVAVLFKDMTQIINIILQVGIWATPIMWNMEALDGIWKVVIKLNPLVYIVNGYRDAVYGKAWFFEDFFSTMYFYVVTAVLFGIGALIFKRLKVHFADVL